MASVTVFRSRPKARPPIRKPLNCESCRHIKQKCDRSRPCCSNCQQRGIKCHYATTANSRSEQRRSGDGDEQLRERVKALEAALELSEQSSNHTRLPISPSTSSRHTSEDDFGTGVFDDMLSTGSTSSSVPSSVLRCDINKAPASNNLSILAVSGLPDAPPSRLLVSSDHASKGSSNASLLLFPCSSVPTKADLLKLLPGVSLCDTLLARYFKTFGPLFHILHEPSFKMEYGSFLCNMQGVDLSWLSLFNVLLALSITTLDDGDPVMEELNTGRDVRSAVPELSAHFRGIAISCLAADDFLVHHNLHTLEALVLLLYAMGHSGSPGTFPLLGMRLMECYCNRKLMMSPGLTVNTAISLRCHLDENDASCITRELKRRCWAGILMLHTIQAVSLDNIDVQSLTSYQVPLPCDVNDVDIQIHGISPASSSPTQNSYMLYKYRLYGYAARISKLLSSRNATTDYADFHALDHEIALEQQVWDERWLSDARNDSVSRCQAQLFILNMYANQLYLLLHRPFFNSADGTHARTNETVSSTRICSSQP